MRGSRLGMSVMVGIAECKECWECWECHTHTHTHKDWNDPIPLASCTPQRAMPELFNMGFHRHSENVRYFHPIKRCEPPQLL